MPWIKDLNGFLDFLSLVIVCAPHDFSTEDFLKDHEQLNLERAFVELKNGLRFVAPFVTHDVLSNLNCRLEEALQFYLDGKDIDGAHTLQDFERMVLIGLKK